MAREARPLASLILANDLDKFDKIADPTPTIPTGHPHAAPSGAVASLAHLLFRDEVTAAPRFGCQEQRAIAWRRPQGWPGLQRKHASE